MGEEAGECAAAVLVRALVLRLRVAGGTMAERAGRGWPSSPMMVEGSESYATVVRRFVREDEEEEAGAVEPPVSLSSLEG